MPPTQQATTLSAMTALTWFVLIGAPGILSLLVAECVDLHYLATLPPLTDLPTGSERPIPHHPAHVFIVAAGLLASAAVALIGWFTVKAEASEPPVDQGAAGRAPRATRPWWRVGAYVLAGVGLVAVAVAAPVILSYFGDPPGGGLWLLALATGAIAIVATELGALIAHLHTRAPLA